MTEKIKINYNLVLRTLNETIELLEEENQQLKEKVEWYEKENKHNQEIIIKDAKVLDEIREYIVNDIQHCTYGQVPKYQDLLQILDKVKKYD